MILRKLRFVYQKNEYAAKNHNVLSKKFLNFIEEWHSPLACPLNNPNKLYVMYSFHHNEIYTYTVLENRQYHK